MGLLPPWTFPLTALVRARLQETEKPISNGLRHLCCGPATQGSTKTLKLVYRVFSNLCDRCVVHSQNQSAQPATKRRTGFCCRPDSRQQCPGPACSTAAVRQRHLHAQFVCTSRPKTAVTHTMPCTAQPAPSQAAFLTAGLPLTFRAATPLLPYTRICATNKLFSTKPASSMAVTTVPELLLSAQQVLLQRCSWLETACHK